MLAFEGNTAPYLMYAHARIRSILRKADASELPQLPAVIRLETVAERNLGLELIQFPNAVGRMAESLQPHRFCQHLFEVATAFSAFYQTCPVLKADDSVRSSRIALCILTARALAKGLDLLGMAAPSHL